MRVRASSRSTGTNRTRSPGRQLAELPPVVADDRDRAHEAAEARAVGAEQDRHVAGEVDRADGVRRVVDVRRVQPGFAAVGARPLRPAARPAARRCATSGDGPPSRWRRTPSMSASVKNSGAACGPSRTASSHSVVSVGHERTGRPDSASGSSGAASRWPRCSTSPARSARPPCPPNPPRVNVDADPSTVPGSRPPRTQQVRAQAGSARGRRPRGCDPPPRRPAVHTARARRRTSTAIAAPVTQIVASAVRSAASARPRCTRGRARRRRCRRCGCRAGTTGRPSARSAARRRARARRARAGPGRWSCPGASTSTVVGGRSGAVRGSTWSRCRRANSARRDERREQVAGWSRCRGPSCATSASCERVDCVGARRRVHDDLGEQRVVERGDLGAAAHPGVDPHVARPGGLGDQAGTRQEVPRRVLGVDAAPRWHDPGVDRRGRGVGEERRCRPSAAAPSTRPGRRR